MSIVITLPLERGEDLVVDVDFVICDDVEVDPVSYFARKPQEVESNCLSGGCHFG